MYFTEEFSIEEIESEMPVESPSVIIKEEVKTESELVITDDETVNCDSDDHDTFPGKDKLGPLEFSENLEYFNGKYCTEKNNGAKFANSVVVNDLKNILKILKDKSQKLQGRKANGKKYSSQHGNYKCDECATTFSFNGNLQKHKLRKHTALTAVKCEECSKMFANKYSLLEHKKLHLLVKGKVKQYKCDFCSDFVAIKKSCLKKHVAYRHSNNKSKDFFCNVCQKSFLTIYHLRDHRRSHYGHAKSPKNDFHYRFTCDVCKKGFQTKSDITYHVKIHLDVRDYVCGICKRAFRMKSKLTRHERSRLHKRNVILFNSNSS